MFAEGTPNRVWLLLNRDPPGLFPNWNVWFYLNCPNRDEGYAWLLWDCNPEKIPPWTALFYCCPKFPNKLYLLKLVFSLKLFFGASFWDDFDS